MSDPLQLKGKAAEDYLYVLAKKSFLTEWCFQGPSLEHGKELCDLLVVFGDTAIIWQVKDVKLKGGQFPASDTEKNLRQLFGARRAFLGLKAPVTLTNPRGHGQVLDPSQIRSTHLVGAFLGEEADFWSGLERDPKDGHPAHFFTREFTEIVLGELDTISDFTDYLVSKESLFAGTDKLILLGDERELLANYLIGNRSFHHFRGFTDVILEEGQWSGYLERPETESKKQEDRVSYLWDRLIESAHRSENPDYEVIARELARANRFQRRILAKSFRDALDDPSVSRRFMELEGVTYAFLFLDWDQIDRQKMLQTICIVARDQFRQNSMVIGVATEKTKKNEPTVDFCMLDYPEWSQQNQDIAAAASEKFGILKGPRKTPVSEEEYPS